MGCRYDAASKPDEKVLELLKKEVLIPVCPEILGGLPTPREAAEATGKGNLVLDRKAKVITESGRDVTDNFIRGAEEVLRLARVFGIKEVVFKQRSPSCGCGSIYDGTFTGRVIEGDGVVTALLKRNSIKVISEEDL